MKIKYNIINSEEEQEPWTGIFLTTEAADEWYEKYGKEWEAEGKKLIRVVEEEKNEVKGEIRQE